MALPCIATSHVDCALDIAYPKLMNISKEAKSIAQKYNWLYVYAAIVLLFVIVGFVRSLNAEHPTKNIQSQHAFTIVVFVALIFYASLMVYLIMSKSIQHVRLVLKILLGLQLFGLLSSLLRPDYFGIVVEILTASFTVVMLKLLSAHTNNSSM